MISTPVLLLIGAVALLDLIAILLVSFDEFLYWYEKLFKILIILILPIIGALLELKSRDDGTGSVSSSSGGCCETPPSHDGGGN